jgi:hypothetical protein
VTQPHSTHAKAQLSSTKSNQSGSLPDTGKRKHENLTHVNTRTWRVGDINCTWCGFLLLGFYFVLGGMGKINEATGYYDVKPWKLHGRALKSSRGRARSDATGSNVELSFFALGMVRHGFCPSLAVDRVILCLHLPSLLYASCMSGPHQSHHVAAGETGSGSARWNAFLPMLCLMRAAVAFGTR